MGADVLIHIGYHKTGTTFLQTGLFSSAAAGFRSPWLQNDIRREFVLCSDFDWEPARVRERFCGSIGDAKRDGLIPVMSDERLSGSPHAGGFDSARTAHRLAEIFPDAHVLIGIREQADAIHSTYQQYVRNGGSAKIEKYLQPRHHAEIPQFRFEHWEYHHLIGLYQTLFSDQRVRVLPYEQLRSGADDYTAQIQSFVGIPETPAVPGERYRSLSPAGIELKRHANRLLFRGALNPSAPLYMRDLESRFKRFDHIWPETLSQRIAQRTQAVVEEACAGRYRCSNRETQRRTGLSLAEYGYELDS